MIRRNFLKSSGLVSLAPIVPKFVNALAASTKPETDQKILVVIELNGGNDGINTVVPFKDDQYGKLRKTLRLDPKQLHSIGDAQGLHSAMRRSKEQFDEGELAIINGVGYPNPNRSHFESLGIWHRGMCNSRRKNDAGWIGHALDISRDKNQTEMDGYFVGRQAVSAAMIGRRAQVAALSRFDDLRLDASINSINSLRNEEGVSAFVQRQVANSYATARQIEGLARQTASDEGYPNNRLGQQMRIVSQLIKTGSPARVYYTVHAGFDTHSNQLNTHAGLLFEFSSSVKAFVDDLKQHQLDDRVVVMAFSEFGRRVNENSSRGTDHGTSGPVFLAGTPILGGVIGQPPNLSDLEDGDIKSQLDFRRVYATLLDQWLDVPASDVVGSEFKHLDLI